MENRERNILEAATRVFLRYGVKRASMGDIASEAGVARQTLYNLYANKDDILRGSIRMFGYDAMAAIERDLAVGLSLRAQIALVFEETALKPYRFLHASPNAHDLIEGYNDAGRDEMNANYAAFRSVLARILSPYETALAIRGLTSASLAEIAQRGAAAFKYQAMDEAHLSALLDGLTSLVEAACGAGAAVGTSLEDTLEGALR
ncbi:MAG: helix-turn-helix domain-containing protein [Pseudomonadota bacterium]